MIPGQPLIDFGWILEHLDDIALRIWQHIILTAIPVAIGFGIALGPRDLDRPQAGRVRSGHRRVGTAVHDPEPGRVRGVDPDHGDLARHRGHPARDLHAADPRAEHRRRLPRRPDGRPRGGRGDGLHPAPTPRPRRVPVGDPDDDHRPAPRDGDGHRAGDGGLDHRRRHLRGPRPADHRGSPDVLPDEVPARRGLSILLAFAADFLFIRLERRVTPWTRMRPETG